MSPLKEMGERQGLGRAITSETQTSTVVRTPKRENQSREHNLSVGHRLLCRSKGSAILS